MTKVDEADFSAQIKAAHPRVVFIDTASFATSAIPVLSTGIHDCKGFSTIILNEDILSFDEYCKKWVTPHPSGVGFYGLHIGPGLLQVTRSRIAGYDKNGLESANIAAGFDTENEHMTSFVKSVMNILRKKSMRVYDIIPETNETFDKPVAFFRSYPDAAKVYNGTDGHYLRPDAINRVIAK
jgi:hypothetical protein